MGNIWFSSDLHFGHKNILFYEPERAKRWATSDILELAQKYKAKEISHAELQKVITKDEKIKKSVQDSVRSMNEGLIKNWNSCVEPNDNAYLLGDIMMGSSKCWESTLSKLNGKLHLVCGNHDKKFKKQTYVMDRFEWIKDYYELRVQDPDSANGKSQLLVLQHFAPMVWNESHRGSWALSGHSHGSLDEWHRQRLSLDVGVDAESSNYKPLSYEEIRDIMSKKSVNYVDHHNSQTKP